MKFRSIEEALACGASAGWMLGSVVRRFDVDDPDPSPFTAVLVRSRTMKPDRMEGTANGPQAAIEAALQMAGVIPWPSQDDTQ